MKVGDLVSPMMSCFGSAGDVRCQASIIMDLRPRRLSSMTIKIFCACNKTVWVPRDTLELISESR
jgi:hypothetical protein